MTQISQPVRSLLFATAATVSLLAAPGSSQAEEDRKFQDWTVSCPKPDSCVATSNSQAARFILGPGGSRKELRLVLLLAKEAEEKAPVAIRLEDGRTIHLAINRCNQVHCQAFVRPDAVATLVQEMRDQKSCLVAYEADGRMLIVPVSLQGLNPAVASLGF